MSVKGYITEKPKPSRFPLLMVYKHDPNIRFVVLFDSETRGTVLQNIKGSAWRVGLYNTEWVIEHFEPLKGTLTMENE